MALKGKEKRSLEFINSMVNNQCDQMVRLFFNIWPFATMKISPIRSQFCQSRHSILPNKK